MFANGQILLDIDSLMFGVPFCSVLTKVSMISTTTMLPKLPKDENAGKIVAMDRRVNARIILRDGFRFRLIWGKFAELARGHDI